MQAASVAAYKAFCLTMIGSQTNSWYVLQIPLAPLISTPKNLLSSSLEACLYLSLFNMAIESRPALSAIVLGIISNALAKALTTTWIFPFIVFE